MEEEIDFKFVFKESGFSHYSSNTKSIYISVIEAGGLKEEIQSHMIHEMTHTYTDIMGYDVEMLLSIGFDPTTLDNYSGGARSNMQKQYREACAITVEQKFRSEMGYADRSTVTQDMIGETYESYGAWPWAVIHNERYKGLVLNSPIRLMHGPFIWYDIIRKSMKLSQQKEEEEDIT